LIFSIYLYYIAIIYDNNIYINIYDIIIII